MRARTFLSASLPALAASPALASGDAGGSLLTPQIGTVFWTLVTFLIMVFLLGRYAWKPLMGAVDARERSIRDSFEQAAKDRDQAQGLIEQHRGLLAEARRERASAVEQGKRDAEKVRAEMLEDAKREREQVLAETRAEVEAGIRKAHEELRETAVDLAIRAAGKLLSKNLDDATQRQLVEEHLADLEQRPRDSSAPPS